MTEAVAVLAIAGWAAAGFFSGFLYGRERSRRASEKVKKGRPNPEDAVLDTRPTRRGGNGRISSITTARRRSLSYK